MAGSRQNAGQISMTKIQNYKQKIILFGALRFRI